MSPFRRLPGFPKTPPGRERAVLRGLPRALWLGTLLLCVPSLLFRLAGDDALLELSRLDIYAIALVVLHWTVVLTAGIAAFIVMVMKGPAYVADAYPLDEAERPPA